MTEHEELMRNAIAAMAFGESLGTVRARTEQVHATGDKGIEVGSLGQVVFRMQDPAVAESILQIFDVSPALASPAVMSKASLLIQ